MSANAPNEELAWLKTVFKGFKILRYKDDSYSISHEEREVMHALSKALRDKKIKQENDRVMAMVDFVFEYRGNPCITFQKDELPLLEGHTFDAEFFLLQLGIKGGVTEEMPAVSRNTGSSYVASSDGASSKGGSPGMWGRRRELPPSSLKETSSQEEIRTSFGNNG